jgi:cell pole-organizing protein PopZ
MAQPSVAREPSMEEILASIRRIIESNDPGTAKDMSDDMPSIYDEEHGEIEAGMHGAGDDRGYEPVEFTPANDPGPIQAGIGMSGSYRGDVQPETRQEQPEAPKSMSLADLAARVRSASERADRYMVQQTAVEPEPRVENPLMSSRLAELRAPQARQAEPELHAVEVRSHATIDSVEVQMRREPHLSFEQPADVPMQEVDLIEEDAVEVEMETAAAPSVEPPADLRPQDNAGQSLNALVSAATVEQVSRSFGELAAAIDGQQRRSLDEMAEDMLRPMLRDWLDDNLPTLVERLVREEIERVARGPRR